MWQSRVVVSFSTASAPGSCLTFCPPIPADRAARSEPPSLKLKQHQGEKPSKTVTRRRAVVCFWHLSRTTVASSLKVSMKALNEAYFVRGQQQKQGHRSQCPGIDSLNYWHLSHWAIRWALKVETGFGWLTTHWSERGKKNIISMTQHGSLRFSTTAFHCATNSCKTMRNKNRKWCWWIWAYLPDLSANINWWLGDVHVCFSCSLDAGDIRNE